MSCIPIKNGFICTMIDKVVDMEPYGSKVWMEWHRYLGPIFYRSINMITPIRIPSKKTWDAFEKWQKENESK